MGDPPVVMRRTTARATSATHMSSEEKAMSRFVSKQKLLVGVLVISSLGIGYA